MSSVSSVSGSSNSFYNNKISGLASGMDTETMIENMTAATRSKIATKKQDKQLLQWKMDAYRSISDLLISFQKTFTSFTSPSTNLMSSSFFSKSLITALGTNSKFITATGTSNSADSMSILGVKQMATNTTMNVPTASDKKMETGELDLAGEVDVSTISGTTMSVKYGDKRYSVTFSSNKTYESMDDVVAEINSQLDSNNIKVNASLNADGAITLKADDGYEGNTFEIVSGTGDILSTLGFTAESKLTGAGSELTGSSTVALTRKEKTMDVLAGKTMTFSYNGVSKDITLPTQEELEAYKTENGITDDLEAMGSMMQDKLDKAFGKGRIIVDTTSTGTDKGSLSFTTKDSSSIFKVTAAGTGLLGKGGVLGMDYGESNRVNLNTTIKDSGLFGADGLQPGTITVETQKKDADGKLMYDSNGDPIMESKQVEGYEITINGEKIQFQASDTLSTVMDKINSSEAGVTMSYNETSDSFTLKADISGEAGEIVIEDSIGNFSEVLLQKQPDGSTKAKVQDGQDAIITVDFGDGMGPVNIQRESNVFDLDGLKVTVSGTFGEYNGDTIVENDDDKVTFNAAVDSDKAVDAVKQMVEEYNKLIELVNSELSTKRDRDYAPLTDEQKEEMSDDEIEMWEEKAKKGMLFNDTDLRTLSNELRTVFSGTDLKALEAAGISVSSDWSENGKVTFDEETFRAAVEEDPDAISKLFTSEKDDNDNTSFNGIMTSMSEICKKYASTTGATKGILIEKAGSESSPLSLTDNALLDEMDDLDDIIEQLNDRLKSERERYNKQFTNLEVLISQMNSQSSWLTQQFSS